MGPKDPPPKKQPDGLVAPLRILQLTDCHFPAIPGELVQGIDPERTLAAVTEAVLASGSHYDLLLLTGDLAEQPTAAAYARLKEMLRPLTGRIPSYCLPGNHDDPEAMRCFFAGDEIGMKSRIVFDRWQIVCLDSTVPGEPGGFLEQGELDLLRAALTDAPEKHVLVAVHHHPIPCGSEWMDRMIIANGEHLSKVLEAFSDRSRVAVFGHIHQVMDRGLRGIRFLASPSTCCQFKPHSPVFSLDDLPPGYRWIELHAGGAVRSEAVYLQDPPGRLSSGRGTLSDR